MDKDGFRKMLEGRNVPPEKLADALSIADRFENFLENNNNGFTSKSAMLFARLLIEEGQNTEENFISLARYALFIKNDEIFVSILELLDGGEAQENLYNRVANRYGAEIQNIAFKDIGLAPYGVPTSEKPHFMHPVIDRLENSLGQQECIDLLSDSLRDLPDSIYTGLREKFQNSKDVDEYLQLRKTEFIDQLETCKREGRLFFAQEITDDVLEYIRNSPEMGAGVRTGNIVYETKIPFMTKQYLEEKDETLKKYYYCHCPWSREAIRTGEKVSPVFCYCSAGFHKKPWEVVFNRKIHVEVLESVLQGDQHCRFAIHLPEGVI